MTELNFIIKFFFANKKINWQEILGSQYINWFVKIENIISSERDFIIYTEEESDTTFMTIKKVTPDNFDMTEKYILIDFNGESTEVDPLDSLFPKKLTIEEAKYWRYSELRKRGNIYKEENSRMKIISLGESIKDSSYFRTNTIKFMHSTKEDYYAIVTFKALLPN